MKLDEYVKQTLIDITLGVSEAAEASNCLIGPAWGNGPKNMLPQMVRFEISVSVSNEGGGGIKVWSIGDLSAKGSSEHSNRLTFEVPVYFAKRK
ncbi:hypothetical protein [Phaeovulum sp.]|uniref:hypothetical protein n=1 Tax=Phaeovulum sp. TaxID=2934796 RepID=UPI0027315644|nr:hypothetical protein [Phaeovulum sp.]MDP1670149.1 hypothetical protein [Phaeovulum sp.]MDZ4120355.1 hypothetical protein [Phaeovulum sp.]